MNKQEILEKVNQALEQIRPFLNDDGGDIELVEVTDDLYVKVKLLGACKSCSMSSMTIKGGVEESIKRVIPELKGVITIEDEAHTFS
ncbi:MAG: NifU family protein [Flavobacteriales bacterium]|jgi:Fe-S cluster biogenesis protein NfuA|nr:MAG: NifU family protein [Flavobacteriales bacterium]HRN41727.1 NifU family protein [Vicingus sp.]MBE7442395.1 NifU family protein [Flavobacteriales bacterium]MBV6485449.1 Fe/S biogenesis protein NfuA [Flavobacteriales bacterium]MBX2959052.1 NifU family protein [Flavobacteriales bacterium]